MRSNISSQAPVWIEPDDSDNDQDSGDRLPPKKRVKQWKPLALPPMQGMFLRQGSRRSPDLVLGGGEGPMISSSHLALIRTKLLLDRIAAEHSNLANQQPLPKRVASDAGARKQTALPPGRPLQAPPTLPKLKAGENVKRKRTSP